MKCVLLQLGFPIRLGIVGGRISNTIQSNIRIVRIFRISGQFHVKKVTKSKNSLYSQCGKVL